MGIEQVFEKAEEAPEFLREHLVERDGKFVFAAKTETDINNLKIVVDKERKAASEAKKAQQAADAKLAELEAKLADIEAEGGKGSSKGSDVEDQYKRELQKRDVLLQKRDEKEKQLIDEINKLNRERDQELFRRQLRQVAPQAGVSMEDYDMFETLMESKGYFGLDDSKRLTIATDEDEFVGLSVLDALKGPLEKRYRKLYLPAVAQGSGGGGGASKGGTNGPPKKRSEMTVQEKSDFIDKHGREKFEQLPA